MSWRTAMVQVLLAGAGVNQTSLFCSASSFLTFSKPCFAFFHAGSFSSLKKNAPLPVYSG
ncbi:Uncharacterised protein [Salmonella enterica subsp. enterica serovar Bovismorbificans]|uniref:Uncharacterized protein n=1 Tax=Salmonella enterica subsp. enterica serovar Bovismorbificans TaxID=58097 RepID=A0A655C3Z4_SALET|nr:Uncharacterised protein [Salmonella enterica subsp. enterica serovar Bovismorbificans]